MTIQKCDRAENHSAHALDEKPYNLICPGEPATEVKHLEERWRNGVGLDEYLPGNVEHLVSPIVGVLRLNQMDGRETPTDWIIQRLHTVLLLTRDQIVKDNKE